MFRGQVCTPLRGRVDTPDGQPLADCPQADHTRTRPDHRPPPNIGSNPVRAGAANNRLRRAILIIWHRHHSMMNHPHALRVAGGRSIATGGTVERSDINALRLRRHRSGWATEHSEGDRAAALEHERRASGST